MEVGGGCNHLQSILSLSCMYYKLLQESITFCYVNLRLKSANFSSEIAETVFCGGFLVKKFIKILLYHVIMCKVLAIFR